jgi:predicted alpha/beta superfamily hydrolase
MKRIFSALLVLLSIATAQSQGVKINELKIGVIHKLHSAELGEDRILNVYLPRDYDANQASYPVIYLLDGSENEDLLHITGVVQFLAMIEKMPASIIIGIANVDRRRDFTFPTTIAQDKKDYPTTGSSAKFIRFVEKELQPYVQQNFRVNASRTIIGQSLGGLIAAEILIQKPALFNNYVIVSPSLWWDNESLLQQIPSLIPKKPTAKICIAVGSEGKQMEGDAKKLSELLGDKQQFPSLKVTFLPLPEENHLTILHNSVYKALENLNQK